MAENPSTTSGEVRHVAYAICKSRTCEGINCCQWPANGGRPGDLGKPRTGALRQCPVEAGAYDDAARDAIEAIRTQAAEENAMVAHARKPESQLLPCPFCGGGAIMNQYTDNGVSLWWAQCDSTKPGHCGAMLGSASKAELAAILHWNYRAETDAVIEQCAKAADQMAVEEDALADHYRDNTPSPEQREDAMCRAAACRYVADNIRAFLGRRAGETE